MLDSLLYLLPGFTAQIFLAVIILWLFVNDKNHIGLGPIVVISLFFSLLNVLIEWALSDLLMLATLVIQWSLFVLLANRFLKIPIPRASVALFCYFTLLMGTTMLENKFSNPPLSEEEQLLLTGFEEAKSKNNHADLEFDPWVSRIESGTIAKKSYDAHFQLQEAIYGKPSPKKATVVQITTPTPLPSPRPIIKDPSPAVVTHTSSLSSDPSTGMTGKEFEALFYSDEPYISVMPPTETKQAPEIAAVIEANPFGPDEDATIFLDEPQASDLEAITVSKSAGINSEQLARIVNTRNRSTDPRYESPDFEISAVSTGDDGSYAIIDGEMLTLGDLKHTNLSSPRAWRLYRIEMNEVMWQPLK